MEKKKLRIAIVATDNKKVLLSQFCTAYKGILQTCELFATFVTGEYIEKTTGLRVNKLMPGRQGGVEQITSYISCGTIQALIYFRDPMVDQNFKEDDKEIRGICDSKPIPMATNLATAELLVHGIENNDLDWLIS